MTTNEGAIMCHSSSTADTQTEQKTWDNISSCCAGLLQGCCSVNASYSVNVTKAILLTFKLSHSNKSDFFQVSSNFSASPKEHAGDLSAAESNGSRNGTNESGNSDISVSTAASSDKYSIVAQQIVS